MSKLIIVESPTKANTIKRYLSNDYKVIASVGMFVTLRQVVGWLWSKFRKTLNQLIK